jgi:hypothetical protein
MIKQDDKSTVDDNPDDVPDENKDDNPDDATLQHQMTTSVDNVR